jgi:hypothetical protein
MEPVDKVIVALVVVAGLAWWQDWPKVLAPLFVAAWVATFVWWWVVAE